MLKKLSTSFVAATVLATCSISAIAAEANKPAAAPVCPGSFIDGKPRKTQLMGPSVGKKIQAAFDFYTQQNDVKGALDMLADVKADDAFDKASLARYRAIFHLQRGTDDDYKQARKYIEQVVKYNVLTVNDHGESLKLLADLQLQEQLYKEAIKNYYAWNKFTCKSDGDVWVRIANAHYELKELDKVIKPADEAIKAFKEAKKKPKQDPYVLKLRSYYDRKMYKETTAVAEILVQLFPENRTWWLQLTNFYLLLEKQDKSLQTLELAYTMGHLKSEAEYKMLSQLFMANQLPYKSAVIMKKYMDEGVIKRDEKNLVALANAWHSSMHIDRAADVYSEVAKLTNDSKDYQKAGSLYVQDEQFKKGIAALNKAIELGNKNEGRLYMNIAESHFYLGQYKSAYDAIKKAMEDPKTRKAAKSWASFIKDTADRKGVTVS